MRYDAVLKRLLEGDPEAWMKLLNLEGVGPVRFLDTEFHTTTARVDKLILVDGEEKWLIHIEFQSSYDRTIALRIIRYSALIEYESKLPVLSVLVLLTPDADGPECNGFRRRVLPFRSICYDEFRFPVIRIWKQPSEFFLSGGLGTLPLALLSDIEFDELPQTIEQIKRRVDVEILSSAERTEFWAITEILLGAAYEAALVESLLKGIANMRESSVVLRYLEEGRLEGLQEGLEEGSRKEARNFLVRMGTHRWGAPSPAVLSRIEAIADLEEIERLGLQVLDAKNWSELFPDTCLDTVN